MIKNVVKALIRRTGFCVSSTERLGIDLESDLGRLSAGVPLATIFDVGGNFGQTACRFARAFPSSRIFTFEPVPSSFCRLLKAVKPFDRVKAFDIAIGDTFGTIKLNINPDAGCNSIKSLRTTTGTVEVKIDTIDRIAVEYKIALIDLLKLDVEGYELPALRGASRLLKEGLIRFVYAECIFSANDAMPHTSFFDLHRLLDSAGFCFFNYYPEGFNLRLGCAQGNVLYALRRMLPSNVPGRVRSIV